MTRSIRNRLRALAVWISVCGLCGGIAGYYYGRMNAEARAKAQLRQTATEVENLLVALIVESHSVLDELNTAHLVPCSEAEETLLRQKVFRAGNLRDAGRIEDGRLQCSALFSTSQLPTAQIRPTMTSKDGLAFYFLVPPYSIGVGWTIVMQERDFYVVVDPNVAKRLAEFPKCLEATTIDAATGARVRPTGAQLFQNAPVVDRDWQGRNGEALYVTRCSPQTSMCATVFSMIPDALRPERKHIGIDALTGCVLGTFPAVCGALIVQLRQSTANQLLRAIRKEQVQVVYQPIVDLGTRRVVAAEALARWTDEDGFPVSPSAFVRIAELRGFIRELTEMVLRRALGDFRTILLSDREFRLNLNITAADLEDAGFLATLEETLRASRVTPDRLAFEVTEGSTARKQSTIEAIHELRRRGHPIEVDDFGTGYSSLAYLKDFPVDAIKIDQSFTQTIDTSTATREILPQILSLARALNLVVIVEGIETPRQEEYFSRYEGPILGQGWLFGRPVAPDEFHRLWLVPGTVGPRRQERKETL